MSDETDIAVLLRLREQLVSATEREAAGGLGRRRLGRRRLLWVTAAAVVTAAAAVTAIALATRSGPATIYLGLSPARAAGGLLARRLGSALPSGGPVAGKHVTPGDELTDVAVLSPADAWAVGGSVAAQAPAGLPVIVLPSGPAPGYGYSLVAHWDGAAWRKVAVPDVGPLAAVAACARNDVWAIPYGYVTGRALHWDGSNWQVVSLPTPSRADVSAVELHDIVALAPDDVWIVGMCWLRHRPPSVRPVVLHWDGEAWTSVAVPLPRARVAASLSSVSGSGADDVWAVGTWGATPYRGGVPTLVEHWDGSAWRRIPSPHGVLDGLKTVAVRTSTDVWAAFTHGLIHWDGASWHPFRVARTRSSDPYELALVPPADAWAVADGFVERWDGRRWHLIADAALGIRPSGGWVTYKSVAGTGPDDVWIAGVATPPGGPSQALLLRWDGRVWSRLPLP